MIRNVKSKILPWLSIFVIEIYLFWAVFIPFWLHDRGNFWDAAGHIFSAWFQRQYIFPNITGWNPFFFAGFPHNTFYGPVYHTLMVLVSFPFGLLASFKIVTILSIAALPFALYYFARKCRFDDVETAILIFLMMIPISSLHIASGATLYSMFSVGLGSEALALPFFFVYYGKLKEVLDRLKSGEIDRVGGRDFLTLTLLVVSMVLTHFVVTIAAFVVALILIAGTFRKNVALFAIQHAGIAFLLCGFFIVPFLAYTGLAKNQGTILSMGFFVTWPIFLLVLLGGSVAVQDKDSRFDRTFFVTFATFAIMAFLDFGPLLGMHAYRFVIFFMVLGMMLPMKLLVNRLEITHWKWGLIGIFVLLLGIQMNDVIHSNPRMDINRNQLFFYRDIATPYAQDATMQKVKGRILVLETPSATSPHALRHILARNSGNYFLRGLFAESSPHARYIEGIRNNFLQFLNTGNQMAKQSKEAFEQKLIFIRKLISLYQINYFLSESPVGNAQLVERVNVRSDRPPYYLYKIASHEVAEILPYQPYAVIDQWDLYVDRWFSSTDARILARAKSLPPTYGQNGDTLKVVEESISPPRLKLSVQAREDVPILVKMAYFPRWKAFSGGKRTPIYEVAPGFMLVYGKGEVELRYGPAFPDYLGLLLSIGGLGLLGLVIVKNRKKSA